VSGLHHGELRPRSLRYYDGKTAKIVPKADATPS
jgi:hypothetical protein